MFSSGGPTRERSTPDQLKRPRAISRAEGNHRGWSGGKPRAILRRPLSWLMVIPQSRVKLRVKGQIKGVFKWRAHEGTIHSRPVKEAKGHLKGRGESSRVVWWKAKGNLEETPFVAHGDSSVKGEIEGRGPSQGCFQVIFPGEGSSLRANRMTRNENRRAVVSFSVCWGFFFGRFSVFVSTARRIFCCFKFPRVVAMPRMRRVASHSAPRNKKVHSPRPNPLHFPTEPGQTR